MVTYQAQHTVHLGQIKSEVRAGETFQFDGQNIVLRGETHLLPSIKVAIDQGWFKVVAPTASVGDSKSTKTSKSDKSPVVTNGSLKAPVVHDQVRANSLKNVASTTPVDSKAATVKGVQHVDSTSSSGFKKNIVKSDEDDTQTNSKSFSSGVIKKNITSLEGSTQEGKVVGKLFKTSTSNKLTINNDADLSRETSNLDKLTAASGAIPDVVDSRESQTVRQVGRTEKMASSQTMDTVESDGSFITQNTDGITMKVSGAFNRKSMKVVSMEGDTFIDENGVGAVVVGKTNLPPAVQTRGVNQAAVEAADSGVVVDVTPASQESFVWDMSKHWKTRVREASQYRDQPEIYSQILAQETDTVIKHLNSSN
jgi:hypothetical protein